MKSLPYFIAPLKPEMLTRTLIAHKARGFCFYINSLPEEPATRSTLDLIYVLGLSKHLPAFKPSYQLTIVPSDLRYHILKAAARNWVCDLGELDLRWIELELMQFSIPEQYKIWDVAERILNRGTCLPLSWRYDQMKTPTDTITIPTDILNKLEMSLASLEQTLLTKDPMMPQHLRNTHSLLISYPETVHLLEDAEISRIISAAQVHTKTEIVKAVAAKKSTGGRAKLNIDDL